MPTVTLPQHRYSWRPWLWRAYVERLKRDDRPILVGPWHGEIGFEALYWIPFLETLTALGIPKSRLIPISRGGAAAWYGTPTGVELYSLRTVPQVRVENREAAAKIRGVHKQLSVSAFDRAVCTDAAQRLGIAKYHVLHPAWMYHGLAPYWTGVKGPAWLEQRAKYQFLPAPPLPDGLILPEAFVAVRFYARDLTFPGGHPQVKSLVQATIETIAQHTAVVLLDADLHLDDHLDLAGSGQYSANVIRLKALTTLRPETHLAVMSAVVGKAMGFIGTYGGFAQLALMLGKPSVSFYTDWGGTCLAHKHLADLIAIQSGVPFQVFRIAELAMTTSVLPRVEAVIPATSSLTPVPVGVS